MPCENPLRATGKQESTSRQGTGRGKHVSERSRVSSKKPSERTSPVTFYRQVIAELRKVVWPTQQQLVTYFIVVMVFVLAMIAYVSALDLAFGKAVFKIFG